MVDEKYTRPQGLYQHKNVDHKKLRKLILDSKLAPCYPGDEDYGGCDLEECPICFLYYPSLNRSRCCMKGICTECFLQMKTPNSTQPTQCPFCKTPNYAVEYRGVKTKEEKGLEQLEEQRVIEAKIRLRQQELQDEEERMLKKKEMNSSCSTRGPTEVDHCSTRAPSFASAVYGEEFAGLCESSANLSERLPSRPRQNREDGFDLDLEDIMVMEAIWLSIQETGRRRNTPDTVVIPSADYTIEDGSSSPEVAQVPVSSSSSSPSGGLACAIAALAERQQTSNETSHNYSGDMSEQTVPGCSGYSNQGRRSRNYFPGRGVSPEHQLTITGVRDSGEWADQASDVAEAGTCYGGSDGCSDAVSPVALLPQQEENQGSLQPVTSSIVPETFEEQMMLAMAVSLAEARMGNSS